MSDPDEKRTEEEPSQSDGTSPKDGYGFAVAVMTLLLTSLVALVLALHALR